MLMTILDVAQDKKELDNKEQFWIQFYNTGDRDYGYNKRLGGGNGTISDEHKRKMSESRKGQIPWNKGIRTASPPSTKGKRLVTWVMNSCKVCDKVWESSPSTSRITCSTKCRYQWLSQNKRGKKRTHKWSNNLERHNEYTSDWLRLVGHLAWVGHSTTHLSRNRHRQFWVWSQFSTSIEWDIRWDVCHHSVCVERHSHSIELSDGR